MSQMTLSPWEQWIYWVIGISGIAYSWWRVYLEGDGLSGQSLHYGFKKKWTFFGRYWDVTDSEWSLWRSTIIRNLGLCSAHLAISQVCCRMKCSFKLRIGILALWDSTCICMTLGWKAMIYMLLKTGIVWISSHFGGILGVWAAMGTVIILNTFRTFVVSQKYFLGLYDSSTSSYAFDIANGFLNIRLLSFGVDNAQHKCNKPKSNNVSKDDTDRPSSSYNKSSPISNDPKFLDFLEVLLYMFYFPSFSHGPIYLFHEFRTQIKDSFELSSSKSFSFSEFKDICKNLVRIFFWTIFIEISLHFLYFGALAYNNALEHLSLWALVGVGHAMGQFFMVKYLVLYGLPAQLGRLDGLNPPPEPRCISWVYSYTDMWKYFDTGLYKFIKVYVYIPSGGSRHGLMQQLAASAMVFFFIYLWHGGTYCLFIWCCGNFLVGSLEAIAGAFERSPNGQRMVSAFGQRMVLRIKCFFFAHTYLASCLQTFFFLFYEDSAWVFTERLFLKASWKEFGIIIGVFYCCIHNAMFIHEVSKCKMSFWKTGIATNGKRTQPKKNEG